MTRGEWYASVSIFPLKPKAKTPAVPSWEPYMRVRSTSQQRAEWRQENPNYNWALACGPASGIVVLDFDGPEGAELLKTHGLDVDKEGAPPRVKTTNGVHLYYAWPTWGEKIPNRVRITPGLDIRTLGGYVVVPPSIHPVSGKKYEFEVAPWDRALPELPEWFAWMVADWQKGSPASTTQKEGRAPVEKALVTQVSKGGEGRHTVATRIAGTLLNQMKPAAALANLMNWNKANCDPPLSLQELEKIVNDFAKTREPITDLAALPAIITGGELHQMKLDEPPILIDSWLTDSDHIFIAGEGGAGKSIVGLQLAYSLTTGTPFYGHQVLQTEKVAYVDVENENHLVKARQNRLVHEYGKVPNDIGWLFLPKGLDLRSAEAREALAERVADYRFVIFDPFLCFFPNLDENKNPEVRRALDGVSHWAAEHNKQVVIIDHSPAINAIAIKAGVIPKPRGAGAKRDWAKLVLTLSAGKTQVLRWSKCRRCKAPDPVELSFSGAMLKTEDDTFREAQCVRIPGGPNDD